MEKNTYFIDVHYVRSSDPRPDLEAGYETVRKIEKYSKEQVITQRQFLSIAAQGLGALFTFEVPDSKWEEFKIFLDNLHGEGVRYNRRRKH